MQKTLIFNINWNKMGGKGGKRVFRVS